MTQEQIWDKLFQQQYEQIFFNTSKISERWQEPTGSGEPKFVNDFYKLPRLEDIAIPHWKIQPIIGKSPEKEFWYRLSRGIFNVNLRLRTEDQINYLEERDLFHDCFGHLPILYNEHYSNYLRALGCFAQYASEKELKKLSRLYWFTSEFGLVIEDGVQKPYGAGILSSYGELEHVLSGEANVTKFDIERIGQTDYPTDGFQPIYFCLRDWSELDYIVKYIWRYWV